MHHHWGAQTLRDEDLTSDARNQHPAAKNGGEAARVDARRASVGSAQYTTTE